MSMAIPGELSARTAPIAAGDNKASGGGSFDQSPARPAPVFPPNDRDLEAIKSRAQAYLAAANCAGMESTVIDCAQARETLQTLAEMEDYLEAQAHSRVLDGGDAMPHFDYLLQNTD